MSYQSQRRIAGTCSEGSNDVLRSSRSSAGKFKHTVWGKTFCQRCDATPISINRVASDKVCNSRFFEAEGIAHIGPFLSNQVYLSNMSCNDNAQVLT